jgi:para-aminobenzoate synthetase component 1
LNAVQCRFEDRIGGHALALTRLHSRIEAHDAAGLDAALAAIAAARAAGHWVALMLHYEVGEWLADGPVRGADTSAPAGARFTALVFEEAARQAPWGPPAPDLPGSVTALVPRMGHADYLAAVDHIRGMIAAGDLYQVNYTLPLDVRVDGAPETLYRRLAHRHPSAHAAFIQDGERSVLSFSPELFLSRSGDVLTARPMKGTAARGATPEADEAAAEALLASVKDRAENLMIVDLLRNDLARMAQTGAIGVPALFTLERYPTLFTLTSTVTARIEGELDLRDLLAAAFPCGSITGAPKLAAMQAIARLEMSARGLYCGSVGWLAPDGDFSLNVAIRTLVLDASGVGVYGVGGGIVHDSDPESEWRECLLKAKMLGTAVTEEEK